MNRQSEHTAENGAAPTQGQPGADGAWSDPDLEAFHDGEMEQERAAALGRALRENAGLRRRLAGVVGIDAAVREYVKGLDGAGDGSHDVVHRPMWSGRRIGVVAGIAATVAICGTVGLVTLVNGKPGSPSADSQIIGGRIAGASPEQGPPQGEPASVATVGPRVVRAMGHRAEEPSSAFRVVLSVPLRSAPRRPAETPARHVDSPSVEPPGPAETALASGDAAALDGAMRAAGERERDAAYVAMGRTIRSAMAATAYLDALPAEEQVRVCRVWADDASLRPIVFERLAALRDRGAAVRGQIEHVAAEMGGRRELVPWLRSHGLM